MTDTVLEHLRKIEAALLRDAELNGEGPMSMRKSKFKTERERSSFIEAYGQDVYDALKD
jgi:hypothetical protein